jgi:hypothetical protein
VLEHTSTVGASEGAAEVVTGGVVAAAGEACPLPGGCSVSGEGIVRLDEPCPLFTGILTCAVSFVAACEPVGADSVDGDALGFKEAGEPILEGSVPVGVAFGEACPLGGALFLRDRCPCPGFLE